MYRTHIRILVDILNTTYSKEGANITSIMRKANVSYNRLKHLLKVLIDNGLINVEKRDGNVSYIISDKGKEFLEVYNKFYNVAESFGLKI